MILLLSSRNGRQPPGLLVEQIAQPGKKVNFSRPFTNEALFS